MSRADLGPDFVQSLARGLGVLTAFTDERPQMTVAEVARVTGLTRATTRRVLLTLVHLGYMRPLPDSRRFRLTPQVLDLGYAYLASSGIGAVAEPYMEVLAESLQESSSVAVLDGTQVVYVARVPTTRIMTVSLGLGSRLPAYCTSLGRVLLADLTSSARHERLARSKLVARTRKTVTDPARLAQILDRVAEDGFALVDGELELGVRSIAAPLRDRTGSVMAAINVSANPARVSVEELRMEFVPALIKTAEEVSVQLAHR